MKALLRGTKISLPDGRTGVVVGALTRTGMHAGTQAVQVYGEDGRPEYVHIDPEDYQKEGEA